MTGVLAADVRRSGWHRLLRPDLLALMACVALFGLFPQLDLWFTGLFHDPQTGFFLARNPHVRLIYKLFADIHLLVLALLLIHWLGSRLLLGAEGRARARKSAYLLLLLLLGPGLIVNGLFKSEWGRARPVQVEPFGGTQQFTPPLRPADQCASNCSFVSGHASMGFYLIGLAWVTGRRRWLIAGIGLGALVGLGRIVQGGHFLSDVVFSFWAVYLAALLLGRWLGLPARASPQPAPG